MSLADFGAATYPSLREIVWNDDGEVVCPVSRTPIEYSHGQIQIPRVRLADDALVDALEREDVDTITGYGYESPDEDLLFPETVSGPDAHGFSSKWLGVRAEFSASEDWIPVLKADLPVVELDHGVDDVATDARADTDAEPDPEPEPATRVGHAKADDCDVYIGRGNDGVDFLDVANGEVEPGAHGWLGNPYPASDFGRDQSIKMFLATFDAALERDPELRRAVVERCRGRTLGCWCQHLAADDPSCHGEVIARYVDDVLVRAGGEQQ